MNNKYVRLVKGLFLISVYCVLYYPAKLAGKFSDWFRVWDIETFGW